MQVSKYVCVILVYVCMYFLNYENMDYWSWSYYVTLCLCIYRKYKNRVQSISGRTLKQSRPKPKTDLLISCLVSMNQVHWRHITIKYLVNSHSTLLQRMHLSNIFFHIKLIIIICAILISKMDAALIEQTVIVTDYMLKQEMKCHSEKR